MKKATRKFIFLSLLLGSLNMWTAVGASPELDSKQDSKALTLWVLSIVPRGTFCLSVKKTDTIAEIKQQIYDEHDELKKHSLEEYIIFQSRQIFKDGTIPTIFEDDKTLKDYFFCDSCVVQLMVKTRKS